MTRSVGIVVPAYRPDPERLGAYLRALAERLGPAVIRVEIDAPQSDLRSQLGALPGCVEIAAVDARRGKGAAITAGFEALVDSVDVLSFADADGSTPAASFAAVVDAVTSHLDIACVGPPSRRLCGPSFASRASAFHPHRSF